jgi:hypothetical protein
LSLYQDDQIGYIGTKKNFKLDTHKRYSIEALKTMDGLYFANEGAIIQFHLDIYGEGFAQKLVPIDIELVLTYAADSY